MRFGWIIFLAAVFLAAGLSSATRAQTSASTQNLPAEFSDYAPLGEEGKARAPRLQRGRQAHRLRSHEALEHHLFARRLGDISAITTDGIALYTADKKSGAIYRITDRNQDGRPESPRPLGQRFDAPTGLAIISGALYIADRKGIWRATQTETPALIASLENMKTRGRHILRAGGDTHLWLGLTSVTQDAAGDETQTAQLLKINLPSGRAERIDQSSGELLDLAEPQNQGLEQRQDQRPLMLITKDSKTFFGSRFDLLRPLGNQRGHIFMPQNQQTPRNWPAELTGHIWLSRSAAGDVNALPVLMMQALPVGKNVFSGFTGPSGLSQWGRPGPLFMDKRGLFVSDPVNGDLWLLGAKPKPKTPKPERSADAQPAAPEDEPPSPKGQTSSAPKTLPMKSGIGRASTLKRGSMIDSASQLSHGSNLEPSKPKKKDADPETETVPEESKP